MLNQSVSQNNERLIRYADVLLLLAEAKILAGRRPLAEVLRDGRPRDLRPDHRPRARSRAA